MPAQTQRSLHNGAVYQRTSTIFLRGAGKLTFGVNVFHDVVRPKLYGTEGRVGHG